jgi:hypothetical protein
VSNNATTLPHGVGLLAGKRLLEASAIFAFHCPMQRHRAHCQQM